MINTIIFDWAGVVCDNVQNVYETTMSIFKKHKAPIITLEEFKNEWEQPYMKFYKKYIPKINLENETELFKQEIIKKPIANSFPNIVKMLNKLHAAGKKLIILSGDIEQTIFPELDRFNIKNLFTEINYAQHDKSLAIQGIITRNNLDVDKTIIIGDTAHETEIGKSVGMLTGAVTWGYNKEERLKKVNPDFIFREVKDLARLI